MKLLSAFAFLCEVGHYRAVNPLIGPFLSQKFPAALRARYPDNKAEELLFDECMLHHAIAGVAAYGITKVPGPVLVLHFGDDPVQAYLRQIKAASHEAFSVAITSHYSLISPLFFHNLKNEITMPVLDRFLYLKKLTPPVK